MFLLFKEKKRARNDNWDFGVCLLESKNGRFVTVDCFFSEIGWLKPLFLQCFLSARFLDQVVKKGSLDKKQ